MLVFADLSSPAYEFEPQGDRSPFFGCFVWLPLACDVSIGEKAYY